MLRRVYDGDLGLLFFVADTHWGHSNILTYCQRPWADIPSMNKGLVLNWNAVVPEGATVIHLGDVAMGKRSENVPWLSWCRGTKIVVPGNHDNCWDKGRDGHSTKHRDKHEAQYKEWGGISEIWQPPLELQLGINGPVVTLAHLPDLEAGVNADHSDEVRFEEFRPEYNPNQYLLCGHVHEAWRVLGKRINVGVDVWNYAPISAQHILSIIQGG